MYLNVDQQQALAIQLEQLAEKESLSKRLLFPHAAFLDFFSLCPLSFYTWRAGFRGYGLCKYGRGRILTVVMAAVYPTYGGYATSVWGTSALTEPFRKENPWYHGLRFAAAHQVGIFITITGSICLSFVVASRSGLLPIPDGMHKPGVRQIASQVLFNRIKPYGKSIILPAVLSTVFMYAVGVGAYQQSCLLLAKLNRKSLIYKEDPETLLKITPS